MGGVRECTGDVIQIIYRKNNQERAVWENSPDQYNDKLQANGES